jgi:hypothetical protein
MSVDVTIPTKTELINMGAFISSVFYIHNNIIKIDIDKYNNWVSQIK